MNLEVDVVQVDIPLLTIVDKLAREHLLADNVNNELEIRLYGYQY